MEGGVRLLLCKALKCRTVWKGGHVIKSTPSGEDAASVAGGASDPSSISRRITVRVKSRYARYPRAAFKWVAMPDPAAAAWSYLNGRRLKSSASLTAARPTHPMLVYPGSLRDGDAPLLSSWFDGEHSLVRRIFPLAYVSHFAVVEWNGWTMIGCGKHWVNTNHNVWVTFLLLLKYYAPTMDSVDVFL